MMRQTVLPFKIEKTIDTIAAYGGLALFIEFVVETGILGAIDEHLSKQGSGVRYMPSEYIFPLILTLNGGGRNTVPLTNHFSLIYFISFTILISFLGYTL